MFLGILAKISVASVPGSKTAHFIILQLSLLS